MVSWPNNTCWSPFKLDCCLASSDRCDQDDSIILKGPSWSKSPISPRPKGDKKSWCSRHQFSAVCSASLARDWPSSPAPLASQCLNFECAQDQWTASMDDVRDVFSQTFFGSFTLFCSLLWIVASSNYLDNTWSEISHITMWIYQYCKWKSGC